MGHDDTIQPMLNIATVETEVIANTNRVFPGGESWLNQLPMPITEMMNPTGQTNLHAHLALHFMLCDRMQSKRGTNATPGSNATHERTVLTLGPRKHQWTSAFRR